MQNLAQKTHFDLRLLYVEDDEQVSAVMQRILKRRFSEVACAKDGQEALEIFTNGNVDMMIVDMNIPLLNGLELCTKVREINEDIPIIMLTAFDQSDCLSQAIEIGIDRFLSKPISTEALDKHLKILARRAILYKQHLRAVI